MSLVEKLKSYKERIVNSNILDKELGEYIGIELFDFITKENEVLKKEFFRKFDYLKNLSEDKDFIKLQDDLFDNIIEILKMTNDKAIEEAQVEFNNKYINRLNLKKDKDYLTLPEFYQVLQNKNNYYRLKYRDNYYFSPLDGEISIFTHTIPIKKQYELIETFLNTISFDLDEKNKLQNKKFEEISKRFKDLLFELNEKIYLIPKKLHIQQFEDFFIFCAEAYKQKGYEYFYNFNVHDFYQKNIDQKLKKIKNSASVVVDDLIELVDREKIDKQIEKIEKLVPPAPHISGKSSLTPSYNYYPDLKNVNDPTRNLLFEQQHREKLQRQEFKQRRILNSKEDKRIQALNTIIERIGPIYPKTKSINIDYYYFNYEDRMEDSKLFEKFLETARDAECFKNFGRANGVDCVAFGFNEINIENIKKFREKLKNKIKNFDGNGINRLLGHNGWIKELEEEKRKIKDITVASLHRQTEENKFTISVKDREIWVNNYLIGKPHAVGSNFEFFEYIHSKPPHTLISRDEMPNTGDKIGYGYTKEAIKNKSFIKILNALNYETPPII